MSLVRRLLHPGVGAERPPAMGRLGREGTAALGRFSRDESGVITVQSLFLVLTALLIGSAAVDVTQLYAAREQLQVAADTGAHAALVNIRAGDTPAQARRDAIRVIEYGMPSGAFGTVVDEPLLDIRFGSYNPRSDTFDEFTAAELAAPNSARTVTSAYVATQSARSSSNAAETFFMKLAGFGDIDIRTSAVYSIEPDRCARLQGLFANGEILPNSDNWFVSNVCVHSQDAVGTKNFPKFRDGSTVSAPNLSDLSCTNNCTEFNAARRVSSYNLNQFLDPIRPNGVDTPASLLGDVREALPDWNWNGITQNINTVTNAATFATPANVNGQVNYYNCNGGPANVELSGNYSKAVLIFNNCSVVIKSDNVTLSDTVIYTTRVGDDSIDVLGSGFSVGTDPNCTGSGAAALLTRGGMKTPSKTRFQNGIVRALGDLQFAAKFGNEPGYDSSGLSIIGGRTINPQSENRFRGCPTSANIPPSLWIVRLAR